jgi:hypothetical protein
MAVHVRLARGVVEHFPARASEWALAGMMATWGYLVLLPGEIFETSQAFREMAAMASESTWGLAALVIGAVRVLALFVNGTFATTWYGRWSPHVRGVMSALAVFVWLSISIGVLQSSTVTTGMAVYPWLTALDIWNALRAFKDSGTMDGSRNNGVP